MIELTRTDGMLELSAYSPDANLAELCDAVESERSHRSLVTSHCAGCGRCCHFENLPVLGLDLIAFRKRNSADVPPDWLDVPSPPDLAARRKGIEEMIRQHDFDERVATLLYEFNVAEPVRYRKERGCVFLKNGFCSFYGGRAYTCSLYVCNMGERLETLQERIVRQGVWHSYHVLGWVDAREIAHNPFLGAETYESVLVRDFDEDLSEAMEKLFFYF